MKHTEENLLMFHLTFRCCRIMGEREINNQFLCVVFERESEREMNLKCYEMHFFCTRDKRLFS